MAFCRGLTAARHSLSVPDAVVTLELFGGEPLDVSPAQLLGDDGALTLLEFQQRLKERTAHMSVARASPPRKRTGPSSPRSRFPDGRPTPTGRPSVCPAHVFVPAQISDLQKQAHLLSADKKNLR